MFFKTLNILLVNILILYLLKTISSSIKLLVKSTDSPLIWVSGDSSFGLQFPVYSIGRCKIVNIFPWGMHIIEFRIVSILRYWNNIQFRSVQLLSCVRLFVTPWIAARQASLSITNSRSSITHVHRVSDAIQPSHPLSSPSPSCLQSLPASESWVPIYLRNSTSHEQEYAIILMWVLLVYSYSGCSLHS